MLVKTRAVFLNYLKYSDSSIIAHVYTEAFGRQSYIISGIHGKRSKTRVNLFQPLFLLDLEVNHKPNSTTLQRLKDARLAAPLSSLPFDVQKSSQAMFVVELLQKVLKEEEGSAELFQFLFSSVEMLDALEESVSNFLVVFLFKLTRYLGVSPHPPVRQKEIYFDLMHAHFVPEEPIHPHFIDAELSEKFGQIFQIDYVQMADLNFTNSHRRTLLDALIFYYKVHLELETEFKSLAVMREVMQG
ncbi:MAG: DNA repair protein RecO [Mangrovibacterium sp.]